MEKYFGTWKLVDSTNFDQYLQGLGIAYPLRKLALLTSPTMTFKEEGIAGLYSVTTDARIRSVTTTFHLGEMVEERTVDMRAVSSTFDIDKDDCLVLTSKDRYGVTSVDTRCVMGNFMQVLMEVKGVTATANFYRNEQ